MTRAAWGCCLAILLLSPVAPAATVTTQPVTIEWDASTRRFLGEGGYPRMARLRDGAILFSCESGGRSFVRRSADDGKTWSAPVVAAQSHDGSASNPELLGLRDGRVLLFYNERPGRRSGEPFAIRMATSRDGGITWTPRPEPIYVADVAYGNGCWEPAAVEMPGGEIRLFFANENPYRASDEQEITEIRSSDGGETWGEPRRFSFRPGCRDGMPVPVLLTNGTLVVAIEDNGLLPGAKLQPAVVSAEDGRRWGAMLEALPGDVYAGAPYLRQLPTGETILSCQGDAGQPRRSRPEMVVYVGDAEARNFSRATSPFNLLPDVSGQWNSVFVKDASTVTAVTGTRIDGQRGVWAVDGKVVRGR